MKCIFFASIFFFARTRINRKYERVEKKMDFYQKKKKFQYNIHSTKRKNGNCSILKKTNWMSRFAVGRFIKIGWKLNCMQNESISAVFLLHFHPSVFLIGYYNIPCAKYICPLLQCFLLSLIIVICKCLGSNRYNGTAVIES